MDFTLAKYKELLKVIKENDIDVVKVKDWIEKPQRSGLIIRHDVDRLPGNALKMAKLESQYGIFTTYYFRILNHTFKPAIIKKIQEMGHEVGYHYEDLSLAKGNYEEARRLFALNLNRFKEIGVVVKTVAMHGRPFSKYDNKDFWIKNNLADYNLTGEAFLSIDYRSIFYFTDTGRSWSEKSTNLRDKVKTQKEFEIHQTKDLIRFSRLNKDEKVALVIHPERWNNDLFIWMLYILFDMTAIVLKKIILKVR